MQPPSVTMLYADIAANKARWATTKDPKLSRRYLAAGKAPGDALTVTPSINLEELALKLTELLDWAADCASPDQRRLLHSCIQDAEMLAAAKQPGKGSRPNSDFVAPSRKPVVKINRRARPTMVDGILYASATAAAQANPQYSYNALLRMADR